ncbi:hypothetical protein EPA93_24220 [Ktedonosporobacter rubrisoli]|uniref:Fucose-specific lectin n=1 Tax=Ktedonosporobacter rubrisoli TaxID=2509675 RepID=A0A4P6JTK6_KTERU|nr:hypothetical protein [Ktedonosporobacter rubrisoli]QBD78919.1 hypothetical protein EPA93_24220 [Ktedonosporobacter rubrisoli]
MPSNITAYEWQLNGSAHIAYQTNDNHIRELVGRSDGTWRDMDITRTTRAPTLENAIMTGYGWPEGRTHQVTYVSPTGDGHIHELVQLHNHPWSYEDLMMQPTGAPPSDGMTLAAYSQKADGTKHVIYTARDGHIHELAVGLTGTWQHTNLTRETPGAPPSEGDALCAFSWATGRSQHVVYLSGDGHIHELIKVDGGPRQHSDLTEIAQAPPAVGNTLIGYAWERGARKQVVYMGNNGNIYELSAGLDNAWTYTDLMSQTGAPLAAGSALSAFAWETGNTKQVVYVAENQRVQELQMDQAGQWKHRDLMQQVTNAPSASNTLIAGYEWSSQFAKQIIYLDRRENPHIHSLVFKHGGIWQYSDLTSLAGAPALV